MATPLAGLRKAAAVETCESDDDDLHMYTPKPKPSTSAILKRHPARIKLFLVHPYMMYYNQTKRSSLGILRRKLLDRISRATVRRGSSWAPAADNMETQPLVLQLQGIHCYIWHVCLSKEDYYVDLSTPCPAKASCVCAERLTCEKHQHTVFALSPVRRSCAGTDFDAECIPRARTRHNAA